MPVPLQHVGGQRVRGRRAPRRARHVAQLRGGPRVRAARRGRAVRVAVVP